jgi:hypothetical protein
MIPDLSIDRIVAEHGSFQHIDGIRAQEISNEVAAVLFPEDTNFRTSIYALARVLGWVAFLVQERMAPDELLKSITEQGLNFHRAFQNEVSSPAKGL